MLFKDLCLNPNSPVFLNKLAKLAFEILLPLHALVPFLNQISIYIKIAKTTKSVKCLRSSQKHRIFKSTCCLLLTISSICALKSGQTIRPIRVSIYFLLCLGEHKMRT